MNPDQLETAIFVFFAAIFGIIIFLVLYINFMANKKRTEALRKKASELGFHFSKDMEKLSYDFVLFSIGVFDKFSNLIKFNKNSRDWMIFDYYYKKGGKNGESATQSVLITDLETSDFYMKPETFMDRIGDKFTGKDIDFNEYPNFSKKYVLHGDEISIRDIFKPKVIQFLETNQKTYHIEAKENKILIYQKRIRMKPKEIHSFIDEMRIILELFDKEQDQYDDYS